MLDVYIWPLQTVSLQLLSPQALYFKDTVMHNFILDSWDQTPAFCCSLCAVLANSLCLRIGATKLHHNFSPTMQNAKISKKNAPVVNLSSSNWTWCLVGIVHITGVTGIKPQHWFCHLPTAQTPWSLFRFLIIIKNYFVLLKKKHYNIKLSQDEFWAVKRGAPIITILIIFVFAKN